MKHSRFSNFGFGLVEILVTMGVLSVGILGVSTLHGVMTKQSQDNKARSEAITIAQSRIEDMRNYTNVVSSLGEFNTLYADTTGFQNSVVLNGLNAAFTRSENIASAGSLKDVEVKVDWLNPTGEAQSVILNTEFSFVSPRKVGDSALEAASEKVDSPTGRAKLGAGTLTVAQQNSVTSNGDGTAQIISGADRLLAVGSDVVLTLVEACQTGAGTCADFVKINGRVYIDRDELPNLDPGNVHILASDAAYCARHYVPAGATNAVPVANNDTATVTTSNNTSGEYEYFDYTCYLGGGWHGNVGVLISGNTSTHVCVGDPTSAQAYEQPILASRRVYRGMLYKIDNNEGDNKQKISGTSLVRYYSQGVGDSAELPVPGSGNGGHDFVVTGQFSTAQLSDPNPCLNLGPMTRADSVVMGVVGGLFDGIPDDFVCLNNGYMNTVSTLDTLETGFAVEYDPNYGNTCPFNPADPPAALHEISGEMILSATVNAQHTVLASGMAAFTSDGPGTCIMGPVIASFGLNQYSRDYSCIVYDWSTTINGSEVLNGWNGYIEVDYDQSSMSCSPNRINFSTQTTDSSGNDFGNCTPGSFIYFSGTVLSAPNNREISSVSISDGLGSCTLAADGLSYVCITGDFPTGTTSWTGSLTFTSDANYVCTGPSTGANPAVFSYTAQPSGFVSRDIVLSNNTNSCP